MLTWGRIEQLVALEAGGARVLSVYLDLSDHHLGPRSYLIAFRNLVLKESVRVEGLERCTPPGEATSVQSWLASAEVTGSGLARLRNHLAYERQVDLAPLGEVLQNTSRALERQCRLELAIEARKLASQMDARLAHLLRPARSRGGQG